jgi:hypothetical protein
LYEEVAAPVHRSELTPAWTPLLAEADGALTPSRRNFEVNNLAIEPNAKLSST